MGAVTNAVATRDEAKALSPRQVVMGMSDELTHMLPTHIGGEAWVRAAAGALKRGPVGRSGQYVLEEAAANNPQAFVMALREAARLGLTPGGEEYYLTPRPIQGRMEILGVVGYMGWVELAYRAGYVDSVIVECVYSNDKFEYMPGRDERPIHSIDWDSADRGTLRLVYAFAVMKGGATSKVVVMNEADMERIRKQGKVKVTEYSPWVTSTAAMWMAKAMKQLRKWIPTSPNILNPFGAVNAVNDLSKTVASAAPPQPALEVQDRAQLQSAPEETVEGVLMEDAEEGAPQDVTDLPEAEAEPEEPVKINPNQLRRLTAAFNAAGFAPGPDTVDYAKTVLGIEGDFNPKDLTSEQAEEIIGMLKARVEKAKAPADPEQSAVDALEAEADGEPTS
jgi:recombination protein RecT